MHRIEANGANIPAIGLGTFTLTGGTATRLVAGAIGAGYRHIDTAAMYDNEREVGEGVRASGVPREEIFLTTKVWRDDLAHDAVLASAEASLRELRTEYVDLLLIHWPNDTIPLEETLAAFQRLRDDGKIRHIGVSNFPPSLFQRALALAPIFCNQIEYHPYLGQTRLRELARAHDVLLTAYSPLARGRVRKDGTLKRIGKRHGKSAVQVTLRWLLEQENVAPIPRAASARHRRANVEVFDFDLTDAEMNEIFALDRGARMIDPPWMSDWER